jgi:hypothetical protein
MGVAIAAAVVALEVVVVVEVVLEDEEAGMVVVAEETQEVPDRVKPVSQAARGVVRKNVGRGKGKEENEQGTQYPLALLHLPTLLAGVTYPPVVQSVVAVQ